MMAEEDGTVSEEATVSEDVATVIEDASLTQEAVLNAEATLSRAAAPPVLKDPETIRQEIEATKDRISDSVEALAEIKADIEYVKSHPAEVVKEKVLATKDQIVARLVEKKEELKAHRREASSSSTEKGPKEALKKAKETVGKIAGAYESLESKLDELLGVEVEKKKPEG